jgi:hypothetical protein
LAGVLPDHCLEPIVPDETFDLTVQTLTTSTLEQHMGSTTFGSAGPKGVGLAMPQDIKINRAGCGRVRVMVAPS